MSQNKSFLLEIAFLKYFVRVMEITYYLGPSLSLALFIKPFSSNYFLSGFHGIIIC
jgi:hypothetical protein